MLGKILEPLLSAVCLHVNTLAAAQAAYKNGWAETHGEPNDREEESRAVQEIEVVVGLLEKC